MKNKAIRVLSIIAILPFLIVFATIAFIVLGMAAIFVLIRNLAVKFYYWLRSLNFVKWVIESFMFRANKKAFYAKIGAMNETEKILYLNSVLESERWFWKYWFGRSFNKLIIRELENNRTVAIKNVDTSDFKKGDALYLSSDGGYKKVNQNK